MLFVSDGRRDILERCIVDNAGTFIGILGSIAIAAPHSNKKRRILKFSIMKRGGVAWFAEMQRVCPLFDTLYESHVFYSIGAGSTIGGRLA